MRPHAAAGGCRATSVRGRRRLFEDLSPLGIFEPDSDEREGNVPDTAYEETPVFETNAEGVFAAQNR